MTLDTLENQLLGRWRVSRSPLLADTLQRMATEEWLDETYKLARTGLEHARGPVSRLLSLDDPRLTVFLVECLLVPRWPSSGAQPLWAAIFARLVGLKDKRAIAPLKSAMRSVPHFTGIAHTRWMLAQLEATLTALEETCRTLPHQESHVPTPAGLRPAPVSGFFVTATGKEPPADAQKLLEAVWAAPDDDGARRVVTDALLEKNDPWGEFIVLGFRIAEGKATEAEKKRAASLLHVHGQRFGGPIAQVARKNQWAFEKGFLVSCTPDRSMVPRRRWEEAASAPHWATVRTVRLTQKTPQWWVTAWAANPALRSLREVGFGSIQLERPSSGHPWCEATKANKTLSPEEVKYFRAFVTGLPEAERCSVVAAHADLVAALE